MTTYALVKNGIVHSHFDSNLTLADFPDLAGKLFVAPSNVRDGWTYDGNTFAAYVPTAEESRLAGMDDAINTDATLASLKAMTSAQFDTWWAANVTTNAQVITVLKRLAKVVIRRVL